MFAGNHRSIFDIIMGAPYLPRPFIVIAKQELGKIPLLHFWMKQIHCLFLDRKDIRAGAQMVADAAEGMKAGKSVLIFPEGTRSKNGNQLLEFKGGSFKSATRAKCPIVPCALIDAFKPFDEKSIRPVTVKVIYMKPLYYEEYKDMKTVEIAAEVKRRIEETIRQYCGMAV